MKSFRLTRAAIPISEMLYDRPYMRQGYPPEPGKASIVTTLLVVTIGIFVLQNVLNVFFPRADGYPNQFMTDWFALSGGHFRELKVWTILSYAFLHSTQNLFHIFGNMLGLYFLGRVLEPIMGRQRFLQFYLGSALVAGLVYLAFHFNGVSTVMGASGAVFALLAFFCLIRPDQPITLLLFFVIPITLKPKWVFWGAIAISAFSLLFYELPGKSYVSHSAHLGGMLAGILYYRFIHGSGARFGRPAARPSVELPDWFKKKNQAPRNLGYQVNRTSRDDLQKEVDRILDKINASGFGSLSSDEKSTLDRAKDILSK
ncbi:MAG: rhomboid family intramembrane serine protease [Verrucomicrobiota bacterium]